MEAILLAQNTKYFSGHAGVAMMRPVQNLRFDQRLRERFRQAFTRRINVFTKIRMMNETFAADSQLRSELAQVRFDHIPIRMDERVETKNEIH